MTDTKQLLLIKRVKNDDNEALKELLNIHGGLFKKIIGKFYFHSAILKEEDLFSDRILFIYESCKKYDPEKNDNFACYLASRFTFYAQNTIKKLVNENEYNVEPESAALLKEENSEKVDFKYFSVDNSRIKTIISKLAPRTRKVVEARIYKQKNWRTIGQEINLSHERARSIYFSALENIKKELECKR